MSSAAYALLTDTELSAYGLDTSGNKPSAEKYNNAAALKLEDMCGGTAFVRRSFTEDISGGLLARRGGSKRVYLSRTPIVSISSITDDDSNTISSDDYTVVGTLGNSYLEFDGVMQAPVGRWTVVYTAGVFADTDSVTDDVKLAALTLIRRMQENKGVTSTSSSLSGRAGSRSRTRAQANPIPKPAELGIPQRYIRRMV